MKIPVSDISIHVDKNGTLDGDVEISLACHLNGRDITLVTLESPLESNETLLQLLARGLQVLKNKHGGDW